jgi:hypothetical protein
VEAVKSWLKNISAGSRQELSASMDERFLATTPAGDIVAKKRLVPSDTSPSVQQLPTMELNAPLARVIGDTGIGVSRLKPVNGPALNAFVLVKQRDAWKLVALHMSPADR